MKNYKDVFIESNNIDSFSVINCNHYYRLGFYNNHSHLGMRLAYFLWIMRGANAADHLSYYCKSVKKLTDDDHNALRGGYGPRLRYWVGADQLQEAIEKNQDIDNEKDFEKPQGVDQIAKVYDDLKNGLSTCASIFNPALDFDDSNNIPDLISLGFRVHENCLQVKVFGNSVELTSWFANDFFFISLLTDCFRSLFSVQNSVIFFNFMNINCKWEVKEFKINEERKFLSPSNTNPEDLNADLFSLYSLEKHLRNCVSKESVNSQDVNLIIITQHIMEKHLDPIKCNFWKEYGRALIGYVLVKKAGMKHLDFVKEEILSKMVTPFKDELEILIGDVNG